MAKKRASDCITTVQRMVRNKELSEVQANELLSRVERMAVSRSQKEKISIDKAMSEITGEISKGLRFEQRVNERNRLLTVKAKQDVKSFLKKFDNVGEGLRSLLEGGLKSKEGARLSIDYKSRANYQKYFGSMIAELEKNDLIKAFKSGKLDKEIFIEVAELNKKDGKPGRSGSEEAAGIAAAYNRIRKDMVSRQNAAGAYIRDLDGYIMRQTHDSSQIQELGRQADGSLSKSASFEKWYQTVLPLLDPEQTFRGMDPHEYLKNVHTNLYSGVHGLPSDEAEVAEFFAHGSLARKNSAHRSIHFKDAESTFQYNQMYGTKNFADGILSDILFRSRNITLMETLGPNPKETWQQLLSDLKKEYREHENAVDQIKSIDDWRVSAAWNEVTGAHDYPKNITLSKISSNIRAITSLSRMGGVVLSALGDKAFIGSEMAFQGLAKLDVWTKQIMGMAARSTEQKQMLHSMGIALDSMIGNTLSRYTIHSPGENFLHRLQQKFYDLNFMNWWNDVHKSSAGELMASHLASNSHLTHADLPEELSKTLSLYKINEPEWNALRHMKQEAPNGESYITPEAINDIPDVLIQDIVRANGWKESTAATKKAKTELEEKLRTYFADRIDIAVPTPGAAERKFLTFGTQSGTPLGEGLRLLTMFKSFPLTISRKIGGREVYGRGAENFKDWVASDHKGKFALAQLIAMTTAAGYLSGVIRDAIKGRTPKPLTDEDGTINWNTVNDAFVRGGGAGIFGDMLFTEYDHSYKTFTGVMAGPIFGQADVVASGFAKAIRGEDPTQEISKTITNNTPFINLFYIRPILDYFVLWNLQEMMSPGYASRYAGSVEEKGQKMFIDPREAVR